MYIIVTPLILININCSLPSWGGPPCDFTIFTLKFCVERMTPKLEDAWETVLATSVVLSGPYEGCPYKPKDFLVGLEDVLEGKVCDHVLAFGPLNKNHEWHLTLNNIQSKDKMLLAGFVIATFQNPVFGQPTV